MQRAFRGQPPNLSNHTKLTQPVVHRDWINVTSAEVRPQLLQEALNVGLQSAEMRGPGFAQRQPTGRLLQLQSVFEAGPFESQVHDVLWDSITPQGSHSAGM